MNKCAVIYSHLGLGDNVMNVGMVNYLSTKYEIILFIIYKHNFIDVNTFFEKNKKIILIGIQSYLSGQEIINKYPNYDYYFSGYIKDNDKKKYINFPYCFYDDCNIERSIIYKYFNCDTTDNSKLLLNYVKNTKFIFINNYCSSGEQISMTNIFKNILKNIDTNEYLIINNRINYYNENDEKYKIADKFIFDKNQRLLLSDYKLILENAYINCITDSCYFSLAIQCNLNRNNYLIVRKGHEYMNYRQLINDSKNTFIIV